MRQGVDYSRDPADWDAFCRALKAKGRTFVGRYLPWDLAYASRDLRDLTIPEAEAMARNGIEIFTFWENSPSHIGWKTEQRALDGYLAGVEDARRAQAMMAYFGQPQKPIYFCVDTDTTGSRVRPYFEGILSVLSLSQVGVYAGYLPLSYLLERKLAAYGCQTEAWSYLNGTRKPVVWYPGAQLHQWTVHGPGVIGGVSCDGLDAAQEDFGQWMYGEEEEEDDMYTDKDRDRDAFTAKRVLATSFDVKILEAKYQGDQAEVLYLEKLKARDVRNEEIRLGIRTGEIDETPVER